MVSQLPYTDFNIVNGLPKGCRRVYKHARECWHDLEAKGLPRLFYLCVFELIVNSKPNQ